MKTKILFKHELQDGNAFTISHVTICDVDKNYNTYVFVEGNPHHEMSQPLMDMFVNTLDLACKQIDTPIKIEPELSTNNVRIRYKLS